MTASGLRADIFDIKRFAIHDGPGIRTTVFFRGCPLECWWCHNPEARVECGAETYRKRSIDLTLPASDNVIGPAVRLETLMSEISKDGIFYDQSDGGVTASGGEPMMQREFLEEMLDACRAEGIGTAVDTSGYAPWEDYERLIGLVDIFMVDLKLIDDADHRRYTGVSNEVILHNYERLVSSDSVVYARLPMIPGLTDTKANIEGLISFLSRFDKPDLVSILPYNRLGEDKFRRLGFEYRPGALRTQTAGELERIAERFESAGFDLRIGG